MAMDWSMMLGNLLSGAAGSLGYGNGQAIQPRKPNGPPVKQLLPSQQAGHELMGGMQQHLLNQQDSMPDTTSLLAPQGSPGNPSGRQGPDWKNRLGSAIGGISFHRYGGELDPNDINIVGEEGPEAIVGQQVIPLNDAQRMVGQAVQPNREQGGMTGGEQYGLNQTVQGDDVVPMRQSANVQDSMPDMGSMLNPQGSPSNGQPEIDNSEEGIQSELQKTLQERAKRSPWADLGVSLVQAGDNWFNHKNEPVKSWAELRTDKPLQTLGARLGVAKEARTAKEQSEWLKTRQRDIESDNQFKIDALKQRGEEKATTEKNKAVAQIFKSQYFDPTNSSHAALAKAGGLDLADLKGWDDRKRDMKQVAGVWYQDKGNGVFEQTNLPADESKGLKDYKVTMPNGEVRSYKVSARDAANFSTQMSTLGARLQLEEKKLDQNDRQFKEKMKADKERSAATNQYRDAGLRLRDEELKLRKEGNANAAKAVNERRRSLEASIRARVKSNQLTQEEADDILNDIAVDAGEPRVYNDDQ